MEKNRIRELRLEMGLTQKELAELTDISRYTIQRAESGRYPISGRVLLKLVSFFHVSLLYLVGESDIRRPQQ